jgi:hypothetical protein
MGNLLSVQLQSNDGRIHVCEHCGYATMQRAAMRHHKSYMCRHRPDSRYRSGTSTVTLSAAPQASHLHSDSHGCSGCDGYHDHDDDYQVDEAFRDAIEQQLQQYMEATGEDLSPEGFEALSDMLLGILENGKSLLSQDPRTGCSTNQLCAPFVCTASAACWHAVDLYSSCDLCHVCASQLNLHV